MGTSIAEVCSNESHSLQSSVIVNLDADIIIIIGHIIIVCEIQILILNSAQVIFIAIKFHSSFMHLSGALNLFQFARNSITDIIIYRM